MEARPAQAATEPVVRLTGLRHHYGAVEALRGLDLEVHPGEVFGLLGPNGAGKTTTLAVIATLLEAGSGEARVLGRRLPAGAREIRAAIGLAPQELAIYPGLSGRENLAFFGKLQGLRGAMLSRRCAELLARMGLEERGGDPAGSYSGGMKRRLHLACALVHRPRLLLLDEPTVGVDPQSREHLRGSICELPAEGTTVIYTTHYMEEAQRLCDRIAIMDAGQVVAQGSLDELLRLLGSGEVVEVRDPSGVVDAEALRRLPEVHAVERHEGFLRAFVPDAARALAPLGELLSRWEGQTAGVRVYPVDLERVFLHLTGHELRDE